MKFLLYSITLAAMTLTVPWFFTPEAASTEGGSPGLPGWVIYTVAASVFYAILVAAFLHFFWDTSAEDSGPREHPQPEDTGA